MHAIIGAGPMGLAAVRQLQRYGIPFVGFELHGDVGGLWDIDNPHSTMYQSAHLISSKGTTQFDEFPMPAEVPHYPGHQQIGQYFRDYAAHFGLRQHYQFNTKVVRVERLGHLRLPRMAYYVHKDSYRAALQAHIAELKQHLSPNSPEESLDACRQS